MGIDGNPLKCLVPSKFMYFFDMFYDFAMFF